MSTPSELQRSRTILIAAIAVATVLAVWLRTFGVTGQVVIDDEWHAIHKLATSSYADIFQTFGWADHSIPLTLFYKAMAETVGLAEGRLRVLQIVSGIALVPLAAWLAWAATRDAPAAALFGFLVSGAPFLVMWSRFARPYSITLLLSVLCVAAIWRWRSTRSARLAVAIVATAALAAWLHPIAAIYPAIACLFVFVGDVFAPNTTRPRPTWQSMTLGVSVATVIALLLAAPILQDRDSLVAKAGGDQPNAATYERMAALIWGGLPTAVVVVLNVLVVWGVIQLLRRDRALAIYLVLLAVLPAAALTLLGGMWMQSGQNFLRYQLPVELLVLFFGSVGTIDLIRRAIGSKSERVPWTVAGMLAAVYLFATPAIAQVARLGPWYAHIDHHWDYRHRWIEGKRSDRSYDPPEFYRTLGQMAPGTAPVIEAPFVFEAPYNPLAYYAMLHSQPETLGLVHDLCLTGDRVGEPSNDQRFRFTKFVFLNDPASVRRTGARYILLHIDASRHSGRVLHDQRCLAALSKLYGPPIQVDSRLAVFDLRSFRVGLVNRAAEPRPLAATRVRQ